MRVTYYTYCLQDVHNRNFYRFDLNILLRRLLAEDITVKRGFQEDGEYLYLVQEDSVHVPQMYFFVMTKDSEIIKAIDRELNIEDIHNRIANDEQIGIGSFVCVTECNGMPIVAYATQLMSPRCDRFWRFVDMYLTLKHLDGRFHVISYPIMAEAEVNELMRMDIIGRTNIEIGREHPWYQYMAAAIGKGNPENNIGSIQISIKPIPKKNIKNDVTQLPEIANQPGVLKLDAKAKNEMHSELMDMYIVGNGAIGNNIKPRRLDSASVNLAVSQKIVSNQVLADKLRERWHAINPNNLTNEIFGLLRGV